MSDKTNLDRWNDIERTNLKSALIIAAEPERYAGIMLMWASKVIAKSSASSCNSPRQSLQPSHTL